MIFFATKLVVLKSYLHLHESADKRELMGGKIGRQKNEGR